VKNLERVEADERDAIILSIGYGKHPDGRMRYQWGPAAARRRRAQAERGRHPRERRENPRAAGLGAHLEAAEHQRQDD
jgi:hypothetical protein